MICERLDVDFYLSIFFLRLIQFWVDQASSSRLTVNRLLGGSPSVNIYYSSTFISQNYEKKKLFCKKKIARLKNLFHIFISWWKSALTKKVTLYKSKIKFHIDKHSCN